MYSNDNRNTPTLSNYPGQCVRDYESAIKRLKDRKKIATDMIRAMDAARSLYGNNSREEHQSFCAMYGDMVLVRNDCDKGIASAIQAQEREIKAAEAQLKSLKKE